MMDKRWLWSGIGYCLCWCLVGGVVGTIQFLLPALSLVLGWVPRQPNTAYAVSDWFSLLLWFPWVFGSVLSGYLLPMFWKWLLLCAITCVMFAAKVYQRHSPRLITFCLTFGFLLGAFQFGLSALSQAPISSAADYYQQPSVAEKLLVYGVPAWVASSISGLWVGWFLRVYPLRIWTLMKSSDDK